MKKKKRINFTLFLIILGLLISGILLYISDFFCTYDVQTFNNVLTPIATILAFIIYYATLQEIRNSNSKNIDYQKINLFKEKIENLKNNLEKSYIEISITFQEKFNFPEKLNLTTFYQIYRIIHQEMREKIEKGESDISNYNMFIFSLCFEYNLHLERIESLINDIEHSNFGELEKSILSDSLVKILNDYLYIVGVGKSLFMEFNYTNENNESVKVNGLDAPFYSNRDEELTTVFKYMEFDKIYDLMKNYKMI